MRATYLIIRVLPGPCCPEQQRNNYYPYKALVSPHCLTVSLSLIHIVSWRYDDSFGRWAVYTENSREGRECCSYFDFDELKTQLGEFKNWIVLFKRKVSTLGWTGPGLSSVLETAASQHFCCWKGEQWVGSPSLPPSMSHHRRDWVVSTSQCI